MELKGRTKILVDNTYVDASNILEILEKSLLVHKKNRDEIVYLWNYRLGVQPIIHRKKDVRPEIMNIVVENRADEIVNFKSGYLAGEKIQYVSVGESIDAVNKLNDFCTSEEKGSKDKEISDWMHTVGLGYRMALPNPEYDGTEDAPFEIYTLEPTNTFVVYTNDLGQKPLLGVRYVIDEDGKEHYSCYSKTEYFEVFERKLVYSVPHNLKGIPIIEYPLNITRTGAFELVLPLLDAINTTESNRIDGVEQFIQALMLFHNVDISSDDFYALRELGAIKFKDIDPSLKW